MDKGDLATKLAAGAQKLDAAARERNAEQDESLRKQAADRERWLGQVCTRTSLLTDGTFQWVVLGAAALAALWLYVQGMFAWLAVPAGALVAAVGVMFAARPNVRAAVARERAWVASLPFAVVRYEDFFADTILRQKSWYLRIHFVDARPPDKTLQDLFGNVADSVGVYHRKNCIDLSLECKELKAPPGRRGAARPLFHRTADDLLRVLHAEYPIASVEPYYLDVFPSGFDG